MGGKFQSLLEDWCAGRIRRPTLQTGKIPLFGVTLDQAWQKMKVRMFFLGVLWLCNSQTFISRSIPRPTWGAAEGETVKLVCLTQNSQVTLGYNNVQTFTIVVSDRVPLLHAKACTLPCRHSLQGTATLRVYTCQDRCNSYNTFCSSNVDFNLKSVICGLLSIYFKVSQRLFLQSYEHRKQQTN